jgi:hypothetical protein
MFVAELSKFIGIKALAGGDKPPPLQTKLYSKRLAQ